MFFPKQCPLFLEALCASSTCPVLKFRPQDQCQSIVSISLISQTKQGSGLLRALTLKLSCLKHPILPLSGHFLRYSFLFSSILCFVLSPEFIFLQNRRSKILMLQKFPSKVCFSFSLSQSPTPELDVVRALSELILLARVSTVPHRTLYDAGYCAHRPNQCLLTSSCDYLAPPK